MLIIINPKEYCQKRPLYECDMCCSDSGNKQDHRYYMHNKIPRKNLLVGEAFSKLFGVDFQNQIQRQNQKKFVCAKCVGSLGVVCDYLEKFKSKIKPGSYIHKLITPAPIVTPGPPPPPKIQDNAPEGLEPDWDFYEEAPTTTADAANKGPLLHAMASNLIQPQSTSVPLRPSPPPPKRELPIHQTLRKWEAVPHRRHFVHSYIAKKIRMEVRTLSKETKTLRKSPEEDYKTYDKGPDLEAVVAELRNLCPLLYLVLKGIFIPRYPKSEGFPKELILILSSLMKPFPANVVMKHYVTRTIARNKNSFSAIIENLSKIGVCNNFHNFTRAKKAEEEYLANSVNGASEEGFPEVPETEENDQDEIEDEEGLRNLLEEYQNEIQLRISDENDDIHKISLLENYTHKDLWGFSESTKRKRKIGEAENPVLNKKFKQIPSGTCKRRMRDNVHIPTSETMEVEIIQNDRNS